MTAKKKVTTKGARQDKADSKATPEKTARARAEQIIEQREYGDRVDAILSDAIEHAPERIPALVAHLDGARDDGEKEVNAAVNYAFQAFDVAFNHYMEHQGDPLTLSRLAVVYNELDAGAVDDARDVQMVITLPGYLRDSWVEDKHVRGWIRYAELFARTLAHPNCSESFRKAFGAIYTEEMLDGSGVDWMTPEVLRVMFPLPMLSGLGTNHVCDDEKARDILILLQTELVNEEAQGEIRKPLGLQ